MKNALLIERDATTRRSLELALALRGYLTTTTTSVHYLQELARGQSFDLIIAGKTTAGEAPAVVCGVVRSVPELAGIPILALEPSSGGEAIAAAIQAGASGALATPIDATELGDRLNDLEHRLPSPEDTTSVPAGDSGTAPVEADRYRALIEHAAGLMLIVDADGTIDWASPATHRMLGHTQGRLSGRSVFALCHADDAGSVSLLLDAVIGTREAAPRDVRFVRQDGATVDLELRVENLQDDPAVGGVVLLGCDVSERVQQVRALRSQLVHDALTGLPNRLLFVEQAARTLARAERRNEPVVMVFIDLDDLQEANARHGSAAVDDLLRSVASRLHGSVRANDTAARFGDDEFAVLLDDMASESDAVVVAERLLEQLSRPFEIMDDSGSTTIVVTSSMGVAVSRPGEAAALGGESRLGDLLRRADAALSRAKASGKARWVHSDDLGNSSPVVRNA